MDKAVHGYVRALYRDITAVVGILSRRLIGNRDEYAAGKGYRLIVDGICRNRAEHGIIPENRSRGINVAVFVYEYDLLLAGTRVGVGAVTDVLLVTVVYKIKKHRSVKDHIYVRLPLGKRGHADNRRSIGVAVDKEYRRTPCRIGRSYGAIVYNKGRSRPDCACFYRNGNRMLTEIVGHASLSNYGLTGHVCLIVCRLDGLVIIGHTVTYRTEVGIADNGNLCLIYYTLKGYIPFLG